MDPVPALLASLGDNPDTVIYVAVPASVLIAAIAAATAIRRRRRRAVDEQRPKPPST